MFSAMMIMDYDSNSNGRFDANEIGPIKSDYFDMFKPLFYFTKIYRHNSVMTFDHTNHFTAEINDGRLIYRFRLNTGALDPEDLKIALYDETYYHDVNIISADMQGSPPYRIRARETELAEVSFYWLVSKICGNTSVPATCQVHDIARFAGI